MYEKRSPAVSHLSCLSLQTATMTSRFPRMLISMTRDRKQIRAIRFGMLSLWKRQEDKNKNTSAQSRRVKVQSESFTCGSDEEKESFSFSCPETRFLCKNETFLYQPTSSSGAASAKKEYLPTNCLTHHFQIKFRYWCSHWQKKKTSETEKSTREEKKNHLIKFLLLIHLS